MNSKNLMVIMNSASAFELNDETHFPIQYDIRNPLQHLKEILNLNHKVIGFISLLGRILTMEV